MSLGLFFNMVFLVVVELVASDCPHGIACVEVKANNLTFDCHVSGEGQKSGNVLLLHGFPEQAAMYDELMRQLASNGYHSVACDQRGYSPGASPQKMEDYMYHVLQDDVFAMAEAVGFTKFHLVGHDHGSGLGWYCAGSPRGRDRLLSYTSLSIPHVDVFAAAMYGPNADEQQQIASQYFSIFVLPNSSSINAGFLFKSMGESAGFESATDFQKALWWYNGAELDGIFAQPPQFSVRELTAKGNLQMAGLRKLFGMNPYISKGGIAQKTHVGNIYVPSLFVCGNLDTSVLCARPYAKQTEKYCNAGYTYLELNCGHNLLNCSEKTETQKVIDSVVAHIITSTSSPQSFYT